MRIVAGRGPSLKVVAKWIDLTSGDFRMLLEIPTGIEHPTQLGLADSPPPDELHYSPRPPFGTALLST
jgi:hypothetical protein